MDKFIPAQECEWESYLVHPSARLSRCNARWGTAEGGTSSRARGLPIFCSVEKCEGRSRVAE